MFIQLESLFVAPGITALHLILQPVLVVSLSVSKSIWTTLVELVMIGGRTDPHVFAIKGVPSPSRIVKWSQIQGESPRY